MNFPHYLNDEVLSNFISSSLAEDIGEGDHSSLGSIAEDKRCQARLLVKDNGIIAGLTLTEKIFTHFDKDLHLTFFKKDGDAIAKGDVAFIVEGNARSVLSTERLVLNCLQRMSGIATYTHYLCGLIENTNCQLLDTRKTTPNFRAMEKWAVAIGGGHNHRFALYDMVMLKDNHIDMGGGISQAIRNTKSYLREHHKDLKIEIETRTLDEVRQVIDEGGIDVIMLDNMTLSQTREAISIIGGKFQTEASGGITETTLRSVAECGVDYISIGALTHSAKSLDLSLKVIKD